MRFGSAHVLINFFLATDANSDLCDGAHDGRGLESSCSEAQDSPILLCLRAMLRLPGARPVRSGRVNTTHAAGRAQTASFPVTTDKGSGIEYLVEHVDGEGDGT